MPLLLVPSRSQAGSECRRTILAIDYGKKRIGLALSDEAGLTAKPLGILPRTNRRDDVKRLRELCRQHAVRQVVVGWPLHLDGTPGAMAAEAARFAERLRKQLGLPVELLDERLSSWEAGQLSGPATKQNERASLGKKKALDDVAAAVILREYLSCAARGAKS